MGLNTHLYGPVIKPVQDEGGVKAAAISAVDNRFS